MLDGCGNFPVNVPYRLWAFRVTITRDIHIVGFETSDPSIRIKLGFVVKKGASF